MGLKIAHFLARLVWRALYFTKYVGADNMPEGGAVLCANHTSLADPFFIVFRAKIGEFPYTIAKKELFQNKILAKFLTWAHVFPVDRGKADLRAIRKSLEVLRAGHKLLIFPEGRRVDAPTGDEDAKSGAAMFAHKVGVPIVPIYMTARRKLPFRRVTVVYGEPIYLDFGGGKPTQEMYTREMDSVMDKVRELGIKRGKGYDT